MVVFETLSIQDKRIRLTRPQWTHIKNRYAECKGQTGKMNSTISDPDIIFFDGGEEVYHYIKHFRKTPVTEKFMLIIVKHLNGNGFIITAFFVSKMKMEGKVKIYEKKDNDKL